ncbi:MAG: hypothetical protein Ta2A_20570 [Treponemataceae bacterium]|nr:MAG: hypothetical protein Ta2A_20570 [Treponemataceae bacterium]
MIKKNRQYNDCFSIFGFRFDSSSIVNFGQFPRGFPMKKFRLALFFLSFTVFAAYAQDEYTDEYTDEYAGDYSDSGEDYGDSGEDYGDYYAEDDSQTYDDYDEFAAADDAASEDLAVQPVIDYYTETTPAAPAAPTDPAGMKIYKFGIDISVNGNVTPPDLPPGLPMGIGVGLVFENVFYKNARSGPIGIGTRVLFSTDNSLIKLLELTAFARFYTPQNLMGKIFSAFLEFDMGVTHYLVNDDTRAYTARFTAQEGFGGGLRFDAKVVNIDLFARFGVPFLWAGGLAISYEF